MRIFAVDKLHNNEIEEVIDLYWFEENYVHGFNDSQYSFIFLPEEGDNITKSVPEGVI